ncbi:MAG: SAM-dependent methyltransferase [Flavobacteriales bacterium CG_4_9_14_0_2_um_filter_35_242]|nr:class I SAM-dependent methyltransferase [Zetaproteobacteria bacterium]OIO11319.1 MAG: SAM-dependent methyltransferase [Flavobacteriaceae bacterium CG1_02_35_72]PIX07397.1 MAG: SAM-dependent methyltransferase [Flavobacteriales bacterium CG_4_8_14_3_um_filter_35_10]PJA05906.1 MAG: SAM-dependent methyltransferase [Flavobacteriales bacterium CG_4_10_14_0_2_um_filter_35_18]PJC60611.1 MAG: SAM-dependent methyltransferase [Flavobacteriales bacterium CG_4_9_14_0_2_um_filter_35_242]
MNLDILNIDVQYFINTHLNDKSTQLILSGSPFKKLTIQELVAQIEAKKKCEIKLPTWFKTANCYFPNKLNIEQTSSEITAQYKSDLVSGIVLIDITGGFGVDSYAFASKFKRVIHCEINRELSLVATHNFKILGANNITTLAVDGLEYLSDTNQKFDWIYLDPSRRSETSERVFFLNQCQPDLTQNLDFLFKYSDHILVKLSPLLDLTKTVNDLKFVKEIHCIALQNEVKELLFLLEKNHQNGIAIKTVNFDKKNIYKFDFQFNNTADVNYSIPLKYLYEPNAAIFKSGGFNQISERFKLLKLNPNTHLFTSNSLIDFPGRCFKILHQIAYNKKLLKMIIPSAKANITVRNFPETVAQIRKKTGIKDGGNQYLFFVTDLAEKHCVLVCEKI